MYGKWRRFNFKWLDEYDWLEYSITKDAAFCFYCYLFQDENINQGGGEVFSSIGFTSWNKKKSFNEHIGGPNSVHNQSRRNDEDLMRQKQSIQTVLAKQSDQQKLEYRTRLEAAIDVIRYLLNQGLSFRGHREDESSFNKGNYIELLKWYTKRCDNIADAFKKAPKNNQLTSPYIQRDIITACKMETVKYIIKDLNDDYFSILVDESRDVSCKEQMAIVLRYVDRRGSVMERFIGIVHVRDTSALSLRNEIVGLLAQHSLSPSYIRGQCYDGASNMQGDLNGLKILIQKESKGAHSIHCFAHQLQLTLVAISRRCDEVQELLLLVSDILNMVGASFKRRDELRESQAKEIEEALRKGELETAFQKKEQDIANAMLLVGVAKERLQKPREEGWDSLIDELLLLQLKELSLR
ncbi:uncharacterized protein LOC132050704 [Lycium ferocissimum]|uniref:uncharacterized protein LOC132050704 n=1 Tax=Lycium ferocissimum TaxID=112874 RepID=UPI002814C0D6|nr:uncharacterized protein LOC132050704 [Lycium ferocissimum]